MAQGEDATREFGIAIYVPDPIKYGELIVLGPNEEEDKTLGHYILRQRPEANGLKETIHVAGCRQPITRQHSINFKTPNNTIAVKLCRDKHTDMFQIGRSTESPIDFTLRDSQISLFACRIIVQRNPPHTATIYAAGFNSFHNISLDRGAVKWRCPDGQMDGLTTDGVLVKHPLGLWREISVRGHAFTPWEPRSDCRRGSRVDGDEPQELVDGSLIDLGGAKLVWHTGLARREAAEIGLDPRS